MSNVLYNKFKQACLDAGTSPNVDLNTSNVKATLIRTSAYTFSQAHEFLSSAATRVADSANVSLPTIVSGTFDCSDITWSAVAAGAAIDAIIFWVDTGVAATSRLIAYFDTASGLPITPNGSDITLTINVSGLFTL
jgi:hypothetical protein